MSNDPFGQFSNIFASEFAKQAGAAAIGAWQEALKASFGSSGFNDDSNKFGEEFKKWFGEGAATNMGTSSPLDFFRQFTQQFPGAGTSDLGAGTNYLQFAEYMQKYLDMFSAGVDPGKIAEQMSSMFQQNLDQLSSLSSSPWMKLFEQFGQGAEPAALFTSLADMFRQTPFDTGVSPSDFFSSLSNLNIDDFTKPKSSAAVGPAREWQIAVQDVAMAADRYRNAQTRMQQHTATTFDAASKQFWRELGHGEQELKSIREIYDFWVDCAEDAYANNVMTDEYSRDFGESINSQANLKLKFTALLNRFFEMLNIPNRREVDGVIQNLSNIEMRLDDVEQRANHSSDALASSNAAAIGELKKEIDRLRKELESREDVATATASKPGKKRKNKKQTSKTTKKKVSNQKAAKSKTGKKATKSKNEKVAEFEIAKITNAN